MADKPDPTTDPTDDNPNPDPASGGDTPPPWVTELTSAINELPGKLRATITDEDRTSIAESVHGLFEKGGAFQPAEKETESEAEADGEAGAEKDAAPSNPPGKLSGFASRFGNR